MDILNLLGIKDENPGSSAPENAWSSPNNQKWLESINPSNNQGIARISSSGKADYEELILASQRAFKKWRMVPAPKRGELVRRIGELIREKKDALGSLVSMEMGKIKEEGDGEVQEMIDMADFAVGQSRMLYGKTMHSERERHRMYEQWHPLGVMGVITAFNFPVAVWAWNAFIGAIAGNTVIWKPSTKTPLCAIAVQRICVQAMNEIGYKDIFGIFVPENRLIAQMLIDDPRVPLISFTGSTKVGRQIGQNVATRFGKTILELSGNNPIIVDETADLKLAIPAILFGAVGTAGQRCTTTRRVIIQKSLFKPLSEALITAYHQIKIGNPLDKNYHMGPLIDQKAVGDFQAVIKRIKASKAIILSGGKVVKAPGNFVEPTLVHASGDEDFLTRETFAPILYLLEYERLDQAVKIANSSSHGLSSSLFTTSLKNEEYFLSAMGSDCGIANINIGTSGAEIGGAFGGEKETGGGRESGSDAWKGYMRRQTNTINWSDSLPLAQGVRFDIG
ncbi:MAG: aldehyde dehydrogenase family protein [Deltaproteobacteria bacterium]|nr:aldehyde dehydrogenase family protein [Deltaproteobacteria bacterium]